MTDSRPHVWLVGDTEHRDFADAAALARATASVSHTAPEVILIAESRPGTVSRRDVERLRRTAPLAAVVALCGSWCEGETRTGRPIAGATRLYWYEFPDWWRRQLELHAAGVCPEWARADDFGLRISDFGLASGGNVLVSAADFDSVEAISAALIPAGYHAHWHRTGDDITSIGKVSAGVWLGGQLSDGELERLTEFCKLASPVVALLDFPRRDSYDAARAAGAAAVLGRPWSNGSLLSALQRAIDARDATRNSAAHAAA